MKHRAHPPAPRVRLSLVHLVAALATTALAPGLAHADMAPSASARAKYTAARPAADDEPISFAGRDVVPAAPLALPTAEPGAGSSAESAEPGAESIYDALDAPRAPVADAPIAFPRRPPDLPTSRRDSDLDGIEDGRDACRFEAETVDGIRDDDGCPEAQTVRVEGASIVFDQRVEFPFASSVIEKDMAKQILDLSLFLIAHPEYTRVLVMGYADDTGPDVFNMQVSAARARAVVERLVAAGIDRGRLTTVARGETRPVVPGTSDRARRANRRVELTILDRARTVERVASRL